ncbi:hypothetical protein RhiirA4_476870 [Rhizophagus irregularis]|uniref:Uncharacterized protein n=1 Tax=Rhizophagus irregularis TaxID=588596 RepID=A0A2I1HCB2_9GLOM|nr:hypothetical protein RhiirA4_476870 [Rhizophagus irregularis]
MMKEYLITQEKPTDSITATICLNFDNKNINLYNAINSKNSSLLQQLKNELVYSIPIDSRRLILNENIQKVQNKNSNDNKILVFITIIPPITNNNIERNTISVIKDLNELVKQKKYNLILNKSIAKFLDENYGVQKICKYKTLLYL